MKEPVSPLAGAPSATVAPALSGVAVADYGVDDERAISFDETGALLRVRVQPAVDLTLNDVRTSLRRDPSTASLRGGSVRIDSGEALLDAVSMRRLVVLLRMEYGISVSGLRCTPAALQRFAEQVLQTRVRFSGGALDMALFEGPPPSLDGIEPLILAALPPPPEAPPAAAPVAALPADLLGDGRAEARGDLELDAAAVLRTQSAAQHAEPADGQAAALAPAQAAAPDVAAASAEAPALAASGAPVAAEADAPQGAAPSPSAAGVEVAAPEVALAEPGSPATAPAAEPTVEPAALPGATPLQAALPGRGRRRGKRVQPPAAPTRAAPVAVSVAAPATAATTPVTSADPGSAVDGPPAAAPAGRAPSSVEAPSAAPSAAAPAATAVSADGGAGQPAAVTAGQAAAVGAEGAAPVPAEVPGLPALTSTEAVAELPTGPRGPTPDEPTALTVAAPVALASAASRPLEADDPRRPGEAQPAWTREGDRRVLAISRTLRSGAIIRFPGDVVVYGDVNAGAHIEAGGNIVVLGSLRGLAHAGAQGDEEAIVLGFDLKPAQLRIADHIAFPLDSASPRSGGLLSLFSRDRLAKGGFSPVVALLRDGRIVLEDYRGRLPG